MRLRRNKLIAGLMCCVFLVCMTLAALLSHHNGNLSAETFSIMLGFAAFMAVGALIVSRRPGNAVGWVFSAIGVLSSTGVLAQEYAAFGYVTQPGALPLPVIAAWIQSWYWLPLIALAFLFTVLLFPTGRPLSRRWKPLLWTATATTAAITVLAMVNPTLGLQDEEFSVHNPIGVEAVGDVEKSMVGSIFFGVFLFCMVAALVSLVIRFRRSRGEERQQLKWFTFAGALTIVVAFSEDILPSVDFGDFFFGVVLSLIPTAVGIAILRYRLYDIDRIINKTLVYGAVTALLALGYAGGVLLAQAVLPVTDDSPALVAITTLAVVALFRPLRSRVQSFVDRRFYRRRYDAARTIESFGFRLRQQTDLDSLRMELLGLVKETMQPSHASLWVKNKGTQ